MTEQTPDTTTLTAETVRQIVREEMAELRDSMVTNAALDEALEPISERLATLEDAGQDDRTRVEKIEERQDAQAGFVSELKAALDRLSADQAEMKSMIQSHIDALTHQVKDVRHDVASVLSSYDLLRELQKRHMEKQDLIAQQVDAVARTATSAEVSTGKNSDSILELRRHVTELFSPIYTALMGDGEENLSLYQRIDNIENQVEPVVTWVDRRKSIEDGVWNFVKKPRGAAFALVGALLFVQAFSNIDLTQIGQFLLMFVGGQ